METSTHALPRWFLAFQDSVGLSLLVIALMGINGIVYASGVVPSVDNPNTWGIFGTVLFVLFFAAGAAMPGIALRAGAGIFVGPFVRRFTCALIALMFFVLEVWASVTERSLMTFTTPADRWLLAVLRMPTLPFSPTVFALSLAISIAVIAWGIVVTPPARESEEDAAHKERLKTLKAQAKAERMAIYARGIGGATHAAIQAATREDTTADTPVIDPTTVPANDGTNDAHLDASIGGEDASESTCIEPTRKRGISGAVVPRKAVPSDMMSAPQFRRYLDENGVHITGEQAVAIVKSTQGCERVGVTYCARKGPLMRVANRMIEAAQSTGNTNDETQDIGA